MFSPDDLLAANRRFVQAFSRAPAGKPRHQLAVLTCMDTRIDVLPVLGLDVGDAHVLRNAGGIATPDALRSLTISQRALGTRQIVVIQHTRCGMEGFDDAAFRGDLAVESGHEPDWDVPGFTDVLARARQSVEEIRSCPWLVDRDAVTGFVYDVDTGAITPAS